MPLAFEGQLEEFRVGSEALKSSLNHTACIVFNWAVCAYVCVCVWETSAHTRIVSSAVFPVRFM